MKEKVYKLIFLFSTLIFLGTLSLLSVTNLLPSSNSLPFWVLKALVAYLVYKDCLRKFPTLKRAIVWAILVFISLVMLVFYLFVELALVESLNRRKEKIKWRRKKKL